MLPVGSLFFAAFLTCSTALGAQQEQGGILEEKFRSDVQEIAEETTGVLGVQVVDLTDDTSFGINSRLVFPQASAIKVAVLLELFRQADDNPGLLGRRRPVPAAVQVGGSGISRYFGDGTSEMALGDLAVLMIALSDNTATNILIREVGRDSVNRTLRALGLAETLLQREMMNFQASAAGRENLSTPEEAAALMTRIHRCDLPLSTTTCQRVREILEIPKDDPFRRAVPPGIPIAFKAGWSGGIRTAWAIVALEDRPYALAVMTNYADDEEKDEVVERVSAAAYRYFSRVARSTPYGVRVPLDVIRNARHR